MSGVYIPWYGQIDGRKVCKHTRETVAFDTYGTQRQPKVRQITSSQAVYPLPADVNSAAEEYQTGDKQAVHRLLIVVASHYPGRIREFLWNAFRVVSSLYCRLGDNAPAPLAQIKSLSERAEKPPGRMQDSAASTTAAVSLAFSWRKCWHVEGGLRAPSSGIR